MEKNPHHDEAHPHSEKTTNTEEIKLSTLTAAITDPKFPLPQLTTTTPTSRYILSFAVLFSLIATGVGGAWLLGTEILQSHQPVVVVGTAVLGVLTMLWVTGSVWIDWFELVVGYWWLSMPIGAMAGLVLVMNQEASVGMDETA